MNRDAPRISDDIDVFHDREERVAAAALSDAQTLAAAGYGVAWLRQLPLIYTAEVTRGEEALQLAYQAAGRESDGLGPDSTLRGEEELARRLLAALRRRLPGDRERGYTSVGPHADDLALSLGDRPARLFASQGQARAVVLAFKIGEIENLRRVHGRAPLLLLDDVSSELDPQRNAYLMRYLGELQGQVVLTTTDPHLVAAAAGTGAQAAPAVFHAVREGRIERSESP